MTPLRVAAATYLLLGPDGGLAASGTVDAGTAATTLMGNAAISWEPERD